MVKHSNKIKNKKISVVTPTFYRAKEVVGLLENLREQTLLPHEVIQVDGAAEDEKDTEDAVKAITKTLPFRCQYIRHGGGTAIQRNVGIEIAKGDFIAFIDDDIRLEPDFFEQIINVFMRPSYSNVGGIAGYITNQYLDINKSKRWQWYKRLHLFTTYEPGRYDFSMRMFSWLIAPIISIAFIVLLTLIRTPEIDWSSHSYKITAGMFGPNQVSSILGLGVFLCIAFSAIAKRECAFRIIFISLSTWFLTHALLTFSRGGVLGAAKRKIIK